MDPHTLAMARARKEYPNLPESYFQNENLLEEQRNLIKFEQKQTETVNQPIITALLDIFRRFPNIEITHGLSGTTTLKISKKCKSAFLFKDDCCDTVTKFVSAFTRAVANVYNNRSVSKFTPLSQYGMSFNVKRNFFDSCKKTLPIELDSFLNLIGKNQDFFTRLAPIEDNNSRETMSNFNRDSMYEPSTAAAGGYHSRRKRRTSKKSRKSRPCRRSSHNKKRHTKHHTKKYRNRK